jgi:uncharacterized membrane protein YgdD (TMEM256/DUF423 family)
MRFFGICGSIGLFLGVALGAFAAHALRNRLEPSMQAAFETGVRYQMYHSIALLIVAMLVARAPIYSYAGFFYIAGIVLFSFSLYTLALSGNRMFGIITPFGGLCFLIGHLILLLGFLRERI